MMHKICHALYFGVTLQHEMLRGRLAHFTYWMVSPLALNTYQDLLQNEIAKLPRAVSPSSSSFPLSASCAEFVTPPAESSPPDSQSSSDSPLSAPASTSSMRPPADRPVRSVSTDSGRRTIASLAKRPALSRSSAPDDEEAEDLGISAERLAVILENADKRRRIGTVSTSEFQAAIEKNRADATRATVQTTTTSTTMTLLLQPPSLIKDESSGSNTPSGELRSSSSTDLHDMPQEEHRQITTNNTALISKNPQAVIQFLQMTVNQQFESTNVIGSIAQLCLVVALEPVDLSINLSLERRRNPNIITNSLMEVYASVQHNNNNNNNEGAAAPAQPPQTTTATANNDAQIANAANDRLSINFFSRFPELAIQCKSLGDGVLKPIFALGSLAKFAFDMSRSQVTPQGEVLMGYRYNDVLDEEMGDRGRLVEGLCRAVIVGAGGEHKRVLVSELFSSALYGASERVYSLRAGGVRAGLPADNKFMMKLHAAETMLARIARKLNAEK